MDISVTFRRKWGTALWHWSERCSAWPTAEEGEERERLPARAPQCAECQRKTAVRYRRAWNTETWHWCESCSFWPRSTEADQSLVMPRSGEFCTECRARQANGTCKG
jgi:hypothetical protein